MHSRSYGSLDSWVPLLAGLFWLWNAPEHGVVGFVFSVVPGTLLLGAGVSMLLMPGDNRIAQFAALGGLSGMLFALPAFFAVGFLQGLLLVAASAAGFVAAGAHSVRLEPAVEGVPEPVPSTALRAQVAIDEALLGTFTLWGDVPAGGDHARIEREIAGARDLFESAGWLEKPDTYHVTPPPLEAPRLRPSRVRNVRFEELSFESGYEPHPDEPGRERWLSYAPNRTATAWVVRHASEDRPWLMCIHGFRMGTPLIDLAAFAPEWLHERLGANLIVPTLPLHGQRRIGKRSGDGFLAGEVLDGVHAEAHAMWDLRRMLGWVRSQGDGPIGVMGYSLGGYNAALLSTLEDDLACVIAGVPLADFTRAIYRHGTPEHLKQASDQGIEERHLREVHSVVSPLALPCRVPFERRTIFGAVADRLVTPDQVRDLWRHWGEPRIGWYQGAHLTFRAHGEIRRLIADSLRDSGVGLPAGAA